MVNIQRTCYGAESYAFGTRAPQVESITSPMSHDDQCKLERCKWSNAHSMERRCWSRQCYNLFLTITVLACYTLYATADQRDHRHNGPPPCPDHPGRHVFQFSTPREEAAPSRGRLRASVSRLSPFRRRIENEDRGMPLYAGPRRALPIMFSCSLPSLRCLHMPQLSLVNIGRRGPTR